MPVTIDQREVIKEKDTGPRIGGEINDGRQDKGLKTGSNRDVRRKEYALGGGFARTFRTNGTGSYAG